MCVLKSKNILKDRKLRQQVNDSSSAGVVHPPTALPERTRPPVFKRYRNQKMPCAPDNPFYMMHVAGKQIIPVFYDYMCHLTI